MTFVSIILIVLICVGFALIIYALFNKESNNNSIDLSDIEAVTELINRSVSEADGAIEQLNSLSESIFKEFDEKYQELLFLYQMIQEKKQAVLMNNSFIDIPDETEIYPEVSNPGKLSKKIVYDNPKLDEIQKLSNEGLSLAQISKKLNMGQGEVKLIMELGKTR